MCRNPAVRTLEFITRALPLQAIYCSDINAYVRSQLTIIIAFSIYIVIR